MIKKNVETELNVQFSCLCQDLLFKVEMELSTRLSKEILPVIWENII